MKTFNQYLQEIGYAPNTISVKEAESITFTKWCKKRGTAPMAIDYKACLKYIEHLKRKGNTKKTINHKLGHLRNYFTYLVNQGDRTTNPIENTVIKGERTRT